MNEGLSLEKQRELANNVSSLTKCYSRQKELLMELLGLCVYHMERMELPRRPYDVKGREKWDKQRDQQQQLITLIKKLKGEV
jgi:hypothetical protein